MKTYRLLKDHEVPQAGDEFTCFFDHGQTPDRLDTPRPSGSWIDVRGTVGCSVRDVKDFWIQKGENEDEVNARFAYRREVV